MKRAIEPPSLRGARALQIFTKNASQWKAKPLAEAESRVFQDAWEASGLAPVLAHGAYRINLEGGELEWRRSRGSCEDPRFQTMPKLLETPKGADGVVMDRRNLALPRRLAGPPEPDGATTQ